MPVSPHNHDINRLAFATGSIAGPHIVPLRVLAAKGVMAVVIIGGDRAEAGGGAAVTTTRGVPAAGGVEAGAAADGPFVAIAQTGSLEEAEAEAEAVAVLLVAQLGPVAVLDVLVLPAVALVWLDAGEPPEPRDAVRDGRHQASTNEIHRIVVVQVHGRPPDPADVHDEERAEPREAELEEEGLEGGVGRVQAREGAERDRGGSKAGGVHIKTQQLVYAGQAGGGALHPVVSRLQAVGFFVPRRGTGQSQLYGHSDDGHVTEGSSKGWSGSGGGKEKKHGAAYGGKSEVAQAIGYPGQEVEGPVGMLGQNIREVGSVKDVFQCRENLYPDMGSKLGRDKAK